MFKQGISFSHFPVRILYFFPDKNIAPLQAGFTVSGKHFKKAVDRNKVKRLMREAYRLEKSRLTESLKQQNKFLVLFFIYTGNGIPEYKQMADKVQSALKRLNKIADEAFVADT